MRAPSTLVDLRETMERLGVFALVVRALIGVASLVSWVVGAAVGGASTFAGLFLLVVTLMAMSAPDSAAPLLLVVTMTATWVLQVGSASVPWALVLAGCLLVVHVTAARASALARGTVFEPASALLWLRQTGVVAALTVVLWLLVLRFGSSPGAGALAVTAVALVIVTGLAIALVRWTVESSDVGAA